MSKSENKPLTKKQESFCQEFVVDNNATQAAIRAGYSEKSARAMACENLTKPNIQAQIAILRAEGAKRNSTTVDLIDQMHREAFDIAKKTESPAAMTSAARNLAELYGMNIRTTKMAGKLQAPIEFQLNMTPEEKKLLINALKSPTG